MAIFQGDKVKYKNYTTVYLLTNNELDAMKNKGAIVVHISLPSKSTKKKKAAFWTIIGVSSKSDIFAGPCKDNLLTVTTYDQVMSSKHICFIGTASHRPTPKTMALLCLVHQYSDSKSSFNDESYIVHNAKSECKRLKHSIDSGKATSHHRGCGCIHGFGSCRDMCINKKQSLLSKYVML